MYEKQNFYSGQPLKASQLNKMEDGIIEAQELAQEGAAGAANMEKGTGEGAAQQLPHLEKMVVKDEVTGFDTGSKNGYVNGFYPYGATGPYSITLNGRSSAQGEYSLSANSQTAAPGNYATSLGYATVAGGDCSLAGGSGTYAAAEGAVSLGMKTKADAAYAISTGSNTQALADCAITGGIDTIAKGEYSVSLGKGTIASYAGQTVLGTYNKLDENNEEAVKTILTVGSGMNHETYGMQRDDAFRILDNRAILFFPIKSDEQDVNVDPICLQDVVTEVGQLFNNLHNTTNNLSDSIIGITNSVVSLSQVDSQLQTQINDLQGDASNLYAAIQNYSGVYTHFFQIVLLHQDLELIPEGAVVRINVNAISNDKNKWETLAELDGKGYIVSAFGTVTHPSFDARHIFELKLFYKDLNTMLLNIHGLEDSSVSAIALNTCGGGQSASSFHIEDNVVKI